VGLHADVAGQPAKPVTHPNGPYAEQMLAAKPAAYWRMSEMGGPSVDGLTEEDGVAETGVLFHLDGPQAPAFSGEGVVNRALHFAGGRVAAAAGLKDLGPAYTVDFWFWNGLPGEARPVAGYLFSRGADNDPDAAGDHLGVGGTYAAAPIQDRLFFFNGNKSNQVLTGMSTIPLKTWNHVVLVRDGRKVAVYLNGNPEPEISGEVDVTVPATGARVFLGGRTDNQFNLEGKLDEVAVFKRPLTARASR
jgi:hypothetical protein